MRKQNVNKSGLPVGIKAGVKHAATPFVFSAPLSTWRELMPQTVINRRDVSRYGVYRWKLLPILKENS